MQYNLTKKPKPFFTDINGVVKYADKYSNSVINAIIANIKIHKNPSTMYLIAENSLKYLGCLVVILTCTFLGGRRGAVPL